MHICSEILLVDHFHHNSYRCVSLRRVVAVLAFMVGHYLVYLLLTTANSTVALGCLQTRQNHFGSLVEGGKRTAESLIQIIVYCWDLFIEFGLWLSCSSPTPSGHILPRRYSISNCRLLPILSSVICCIRLVILRVLLLRLAIVVEVVEH